MNDEGNGIMNIAERQVKESFIDGYTSAMDRVRPNAGTNTLQAEAERVWAEENTTTNDSEEIKVAAAIIDEWFGAMAGRRDGSGANNITNEDIEDCASNIVEALRNLSEAASIPPFIDRYVKARDRDD